QVEDTVPRGMTVPIDFVLIGYKDTESTENFEQAKKEGWAAFKKALGESWGLCASSANWWIAQCAQRDTEPVTRERVIDKKTKKETTEINLPNLPIGYADKELRR